LLFPIANHLYFKVTPVPRGLLMSKSINRHSKGSLATLLLALCFSALNYPCVGQEQLSLSKPIYLLWSFETHDMSNITPTLAEETIYVPLSNGNIVALQTDNGELLWRSEVGGRVSASPFSDLKGVYIASESLPSKSKYPQAMGTLRALSPQNGITLWMHSLPSPVRGALISNGATLFGGTADGRVYALKKDTGETLWVKYNSAPFASNPILHGGNLYIGDEEGKLIVIDQATGNTVWFYRTRKAIRAPVAISGGIVFVGSTDGTIYALNETTGRLKWRSRTNAAVQSVQTTERCILATSLDNFVYCISIQHGEKIWKRRLTGRVIAQPLVSKDSVLLPPLVGEECVVLSLQDGKTINTIFVGEDNNTEASPLFSGNLLFLPTRKGLLAFSSQNANTTDQK
jgi:eukaryotic-like serine/threonine-protein kinase